MFGVGARPPAFTLETPDGEQVSLGEMTGQEEDVLLVFLRHLG